MIPNLKKEGETKFVVKGLKSTTKILGNRLTITKREENS